MIEKIKFRFIEEKRIISLLEEGHYRNIKDEPFPGALCVSALAFLCLHDIENAVFQLRNVFGNSYIWHLYCRCASSCPALNEDLLVECLSSIIKNNKNVPVQNIFRLLSSVEFLWDEKKRGQRPSKYLAELLDYKYISDELADAYRVLGLEPGSDIEKVRAAHRKLAAKFHPDVSIDENKKSSLSSFVRIQTAYETIVRQLS